MLRRTASILLPLTLAALAGCPVQDPDSLPFEHVDANVHDTIGSLVVVTWEQLVEGEGYVAYAVDGEEWRQSPLRSWAVGEQRQILVGLPYDAGVRYGLVIDDGTEPRRGEEHEIRTGEIPPGVPRPEVLAADPEAWDPSFEYVLASLDSGDVTVRFWTHVLDRQGRVVWAWPTEPIRSTLQAQPSYDERTLLIEYNSYWGLFDDGAASVVNRVTLDGTVQEVIETPGLHHPYVELPDGVLAWGASHDTSETLDVRSSDGEIATLWDCAEFMDEVGTGGWCSSNTLWWDEDHQRFLFSFFSLETVVEIGAGGDTLRHFGHAPGAWGFAPPESAFHWQHGSVFTEDGTLLVSCRHEPDGDVEQAETVVREYALDDASETLAEVWSFAVGDGIYGDMMGEAHRLPGGNTLHNSGTAVRLREAAPDGTVVWDVTWDRGDYLGRTTPLGDLYDYLP